MKGGKEGGRALNKISKKGVPFPLAVSLVVVPSAMPEWNRVANGHPFIRSFIIFYSRTTIHRQTMAL
jgi:hypothetical protein